MRGSFYAFRSYWSYFLFSIHAILSILHYLKNIPGIGEVIFSKILEERKRKRFDNQKSLVECIPKFPRGINNLRFLSSLLGRMDIARHVGCSRHMGCSRMDIVVSFRSASHFTLGPWGMHRYLRAPLAIQFLSENLLITFIWDTPAHVLCGSQQYHSHACQWLFDSDIHAALSYSGTNTDCTKTASLYHSNSFNNHGKIPVYSNITSGPSLKIWIPKWI